MAKHNEQAKAGNDTKVTDTGGHTGGTDSANGNDTAAGDMNAGLTTAFDDSLTINRSVPVVPASSVPAPPGAFHPTDTVSRQRRLRKVDQANLSELQGALRQIVQRGSDIVKHLGPNAPSAALSSALLTRFDGISASRTATLHFLAYLDEIEDIAISDMDQVTEQVDKLYQANVDSDSKLLPLYNTVVAYRALHGASVSLGIARKKAEKAR